MAANKNISATNVKKPNTKKTTKMKIYISGKITGYEPTEAKDKFKRSEKKLTNKGHKAVNPFKVSQA